MVRGDLSRLWSFGCLRYLVEHFLALLKVGHCAIFCRGNAVPMDKDLATAVLNDESVALFEAKPLDTPVEPASVLDLMCTIGA